MPAPSCSHEGVVAAVAVKVSGFERRGFRVAVSGATGIPMYLLPRLVPDGFVIDRTAWRIDVYEIGHSFFLTDRSRKALARLSKYRALQRALPAPWAMRLFEAAITPIPWEVDLETGRPVFEGCRA
jgi:hypothetical protein